LQVALFDGEGETFAFFGAAFLERRRGAESGIKGDIVGLVPGRARFDVPSVLAFGFGEGASARMFAG
jgi:hypothetical protein